MKKLALLILGSLAVALPAFADLGDTYAQSCQRYGGRGEVDRKNKAILFHTSHHYVSERFVKNRCVFLLLTPDANYGSYSVEDGIRILRTMSDKEWIRYDGGYGAIAAWISSDKSIVAGLYPNEKLNNAQLQIAYASYLTDKGLLHDGPDNPGKAPVEDDDAPGTSM